MNVALPRKKLDLASAIAEGDVRVLLMVLVHMTGDMRWLEPPYKTKRDVKLIPDPDAGVPNQIQDEIREAVLKLFEHGLAAIDVKPEAHDDYIRRVDAEHEQMIWTHPGMTTYYRNGLGRVFSAMPWRFVDYWQMTHDADLKDYRQTRA